MSKNRVQAVHLQGGLFQRDNEQRLIPNTSKHSLSRQIPAGEESTTIPFGSTNSLTIRLSRLHLPLGGDVVLNAAGPRDTCRAYKLAERVDIPQLQVHTAANLMADLRADVDQRLLLPHALV